MVDPKRSESTSLVKTKLYAPVLRPYLIGRTRLIEKLSAALETKRGFARKLTLISAPAGYGKTTLAGQWLSTLDLPVAWLSLEPADNDPVRFLRYLIASLQRVAPKIGHETETILSAEQALADEILITSLINELAASAEPLVLVLDDYHVIRSPVIHQQLAFLLNHQPATLHLVLTTREDPLLPLPRLRAAGETLEIRQQDLRFTADEALDFLKRMPGLKLSVEDVATLQRRTEGWIAGLQMAALSLRDCEDTKGAVQAFSGSNRFILDYFMDEIFERQSPRIRDFLLKTSLLERLSASLCDRVTEGSESQEVLENLEQDNLFILPLDEQRQWYRYHHLFRELLSHRLMQTHPQHVPEFHARASSWYQENGHLAEAIDHSLSAASYDQAAQMLEQAAEAIMLRGEFATVMSWGDRFPSSELKNKPMARVYVAWARFLIGRPQDEIRSLMEVTKGREGDQALHGAIVSLQALYALLNGDAESSIAWAQEALDHLPAERAFIRGVVARNLASTHLMFGDLRAASLLLEEEVEQFAEQNDSVGIVATLQRLGASYSLQGQLRKAFETYQRALQCARDPQGRLDPMAVKVPISLGEIYREWGQYRKAAEWISQGIELSEAWVKEYGLAGYIILARLRQSQGNLDGAQAALDKAKSLAGSYESTQLDDLMVDVYQARLWLTRGDLEAVRDWLTHRGFEEDPDTWTSKTGFKSPQSPYLVAEHTSIVMARYLLAVGKVQNAISILEDLLPAAEALGRNQCVLEVLILIARAFQMLREEDKALQVLVRAVHLAEPEGYVSIFIDEGESIATLLSKAREQGVGGKYLQTLLTAFDDDILHRVRRASQVSQGLIEPLSERELEVLALVSKGYTNQQIADRLYVTLSTIKWHTHNIYQKLGVQNRLQAVEKVRALGILSE